MKRELDEWCKAGVRCVAGNKFKNKKSVYLFKSQNGEQGGYVDTQRAG